MSSDFKYTAGLNHVGSYQVSGIPFVTGNLTVPASGSTPLKIEFPYVTQWVSVTNTDSKHVRLGFSEQGVKNGGSNYVLIHENTKPTFNMYNLKLTEVYLLSDTGQSVINFSLVAGLTNIPVGRVDNISPSGSNWSGSVGVG
jgi:hypothetical protein